MAADLGLRLDPRIRTLKGAHHIMNRVLRIALLALCTLFLVAPSFGQVAVTVAFGPPALPVYELPPCPGDGFLWTPGYWAWDPDYGYYWVPGTWVAAPEPGLLWTPGWWGWDTGGFMFHDGFWGTEVGFYGGIDYGFGYFGTGFAGGRWDGGVFRYNTAVLTIDTTVIHNTYVDRTVIVNHTTENRVSYNGGDGGVSARPTPEEDRADQGRHVGPVAAQQQHLQAARSNPDMRASQNQGKPAIAATSRPGDFSGHGVVAAKEAGAPYHAPPNAPGGNGHPAPGNARPGETPENTHPGETPAPAPEKAPAHASDLQPHQVTAPNTGNPQLDSKYQKQQQKLIDKQNQEHQKLVAKQNQDHQKAQQQNYSQQKNQQMEQKHQQQTQQLEQRHTQQMQQLQSHQSAPRPR
jgi:WXXGXW repeat (2 copies)